MKKLIYLTVAVALFASCKKSDETLKEAYSYKYKIAGSEVSGNETTGVISAAQNSTFYLMFGASTSQMLSINTQPLSFFNGIGTYSIGTGANGLSMMLTMAGNNIYSATSGSMVISEFTPPNIIKGTFNATLESLTTSGSTIQISEGSFYLPVTQ